MEKLLQLKIYVDGVNDTPFPQGAEEPIEISAFRYDAKRMGGAPTITAIVNYHSCLDDEWTDNVYAEFNGEKYYLKQTPTSSYNNESTMYKHDLELVSERAVLDNVYFFDTVVGDPQGDDKPVSDSTKVVFFGGIREFVARLNSSLQYSGLDYTVVVDEEVETEEKLMSFENQFFSNVLQEIYNVYEVPYYFDGKTIHIGFANSDAVVPTLSYGVDDALLSITKNNANYKIVNRATATGSSDNIPFYYPNNSPKGEIEAEVSRSGLKVEILDNEKYANEVGIDESIVFEAPTYGDTTLTLLGDPYISGSIIPITFAYNYKINVRYTLEAYTMGKIPLGLNSVISTFKKVGWQSNVDDWESLPLTKVENRLTVYATKEGGEKVLVAKNQPSGTFDIAIDSIGSWTIDIEVMFVPSGDYQGIPVYVEFALSLTGEENIQPRWLYNAKEVNPKDIGLRIDNSTAVSGDTITQRLIKYVKTSQNLMPSIYRNSDGAERFYDAINYPFPISEWHKQRFGEYPILITNTVHNDAFKQGDEYVHFNHTFIGERPKEHIITFEDIKPTIEATEVVQPEGSTFSGASLRVDMFSEFAYDLNDNDETYEDEEGNVYFKHPYFYGKLRVMDFNLFDHAIEQQPMTISFTSGDCGACNFEIGVTEEYPQKNPVQVDEDGNLLRDENGMVLAGVEGTQQDVTTFQDRQQDTSKYEVWIALRKEEETYSILMPQGAHKPKADTLGVNNGDTFVILGINLPKSYILNAEKRLEEEIIKYIKQNNDEKFTFSIDFSRIYFEENPNILASLNENSKIAITYDNKVYQLYVSSFSYNMTEGDVLPEIRVELNETLAVSQNALQNAISQVKKEFGVALSSIDVVGAATPYFLRKDADDEAQGRINFKKGIKFGEGGKVEILDNNSAKLTIEYLEVTKKASFTSLEIQEKTHVGGQMLITPAAINCGEVEEFEDYYRCYFQTKGEDGDEIFNQFAVNDQAICQTFNAWGSKYYWRLVTGIGEDYIDLSKADCDENSDVPSAGDKIIQMGNRVDAARQNAIVIAAYGDGSPYIIQYKGINAYETPESTVVTKLSSTENKFTGIVAMQAGSTGLDELQEFVDLQVLAGDANESAEEARRKANEAKNAVDNLEVGGQNLLRNSGFTGDYLSEQLADNSVLDSASEMYNPPFVHWETSNATVQNSIKSVSGKEVVLTNGSLIQNLFYAVVAGEEYVLSFKAKGTELNYTVGGASKGVALTSEWTQYTEKVTATSEGKAFVITNATCTICDLQFEKGNTATAWSNSPLDNSSDRAYYQSLKYLNQAIEEGTTVTQGGLILSSTINLGEWTFNESTGKNELTSVHAGMNGVFAGESPNEVPAFWAGGNTTKAIATINKYLSTPSPETPEGELPFVVSHDGRIIANDAIIRGTIYADDGEFSGFIKKRPTIINPSNYEQYLTPYGEPWWFDLDLSKAGSFIIFEGAWADNPHFYMPQLGVMASGYDEDSMPTGWKYYTMPSGYSVNDVFALIGQKVIIVNNSSINVEICTDMCFWIAPSSMAIFECEASIVDGSDDWIGDSYWKVNWTRKQLAIPDLITSHPIE